MAVAKESHKSTVPRLTANRPNMCPPKLSSEVNVGEDKIQAVVTVAAKSTKVNIWVLGTLVNAIAKTKDHLYSAESEVPVTVPSRVKDLATEDDVEFIHVVLGQLDNGSHVLSEVVKQRLIDANEDAASSGAILPRPSNTEQTRIFKLGTNLTIQRVAEVISRDSCQYKAEQSSQEDQG